MFSVVLILVLMEDALRVFDLNLQETMEVGLNPCSNGRCSASYVSGDIFDNMSSS